MTSLERMPSELLAFPKAREDARQRFFLELLERQHALTASSRVLEVGAGDAAFARALLDRCPGAAVTAWDASYSDEDIGALSKKTGLLATRREPQGPFDLIALLDVLETVDDEGPLLDLARCALAPGGRLLVSVAAWPRLFAASDIQLRHRRRYTPRHARELLEKHGLLVLGSGGLFHSLLAPRWLQASWQMRTGRAALPGRTVRVSLSRRVALPVAAALLRVDTAASALFSIARWEAPGLGWWALCARGSI